MTFTPILESDHSEIRSPNQERESSSAQTIIVIDVKGAWLGLTCLNMMACKLSFFENTIVPTQYASLSLESLIVQFEPTLVYISSRAPNSFTDSLSLLEHQYQFTFNIKRHVDFSTEKLTHYLSHVKNYMHNKGIVSQEMKVICDCIEISTNMQLSAGCFCALWQIVEAFADPNFLGFPGLTHSIEIITMKGKMFIDSDSLYSLQILPRHEKKSKPHSKVEKSSLIEYLDKTVTACGSQLLKSWIIRPLLDLERIQERLDLIDAFTDSQNLNLVPKIQCALRQVGNIHTILSTLKSGNNVWRPWKMILRFLEVALDVRELVNALEYGGSFPPRIIRYFKTDFDHGLFNDMLQYLKRYIDVEACEDSSSLRILPNIDGTLDELRKIYDSLEQILQQVGKLLISQVPAAIGSHLNTAYIPQIGFLVSIEIIDLQNYSHIKWDEIFRTETTIYFKNEIVKDMDVKYGDIYELICDREIEICHDLQTLLLEEEPFIIDVFEALTELDCHLALACVAHENNLVRPILHDGYEISIRNGRHPLMETHVGNFIPNNTAIGKGLEGSDDRIMILTGANYSGKSVYLTQVSLIVVLAQIGCFVPAEYASIGLVDKILTRITSQESVDKLQSTFAIDVQQLSKCLSFFSDKSLLIIDEFGKGSDMVDGTALFGATLKYLNNLQTPPRTLCSTHFHELFKNNMSILGGMEGMEKTCFYYMEVVKDATGRVAEELTYLYHLKEGYSMSSFGHECAKMCGIPSSIVKRAESLARDLSEGRDIFESFNLLSEEEETNFEQARQIVGNFLRLQLDLVTGDEEAKQVYDSIQHMFNEPAYSMSENTL